MDRKFVKLNIYFTVLLQIVTIACGFIIPRLTLSYFGSEMNGLCNSVAQFLNYIQLLEGGLSGVAMAALYKPLAENDTAKLSSAIRSIENFFRKIGIAYVIYALGVTFLYPLLVPSSFSYASVAVLIVIIGAGAFIQYFFSLTFRLLINADQHGYIVSAANILFYLLNLGLVILSLRIFPSIHLVKICAVVSYITQPIIFGIYTKKHYPLDKHAPVDNSLLAQRWDGFGQNLAYFIHTNTDITVITIFSTLTEVSVYSVYYMVIRSLKTLIISISSAVYPSFGKVLVSGTQEEIDKAFDEYEFLMNIITTFAFSCCIVLITSFVHVYTLGIDDADYSRSTFAIVLCCAEAVYCFRDPFVSAAYAAGHFRQTAKYAYLEAGINIVLSVILIQFWGLVGIAIGTLAGMTCRMILQVIYTKDKLLFRPISKWLKNFILYTVLGAVSILLAFCIPFQVENYFQWFLYTLITAAITAVIIAAGTLLFRRQQLKYFIGHYFLHHKEKQ